MRDSLKEEAQAFWALYNLPEEASQHQYQTPSHGGGVLGKLVGNN